MPLVRLTQEMVERAQPGKLLCDDKVTGLLLISQKRVKTWCAQREVKDPETGIRKTARVKLGHFPDVSVQEARDLAKEELRKMEKGRNPHAARNPKMTVKAAVEDYISGAVDLQPRTVEGYRYHLDKYLTPIHNTPLSDLGEKPGKVRELFLSLSKEKGKATANGVMRTLGAVYNGMRELNPELPPNPVRKGVIRMHKIAARKGRIPDDGFAAWGASLATLKNPVRRAMRMFFLLTGQRDEAVRTMKWKDVHFERNFIHFPTPKGGPDAAFDLPMSPQVRRVLEFVRIDSTDDRAFAGSEWVWPTYAKKSRDITHINTSREDEKPELLRAHDLRRTFISVGYEVAPNKFISYIANHACKDTITDEYFVPAMETVRGVLENVDKAILAKMGTDLETLLGEHFQAGPNKSVQRQA
ncbi:MAG: integrase family protein [Candidatus Hydrogenedentes bacterium]|nr:integrase family protein [Candidatus Hydrogenedentota bacterium]